MQSILSFVSFNLFSFSFRSSVRVSPDERIITGDPRKDEAVSKVRKILSATGKKYCPELVEAMKPMDFLELSALLRELYSDVVEFQPF